MRSHFSQNLHALCAVEGSVSQVCRQIGINRQQFGRYLSGAARPNAHTLARICMHFGVTAEALEHQPEAFAAGLSGGPRTTPEAMLMPVTRGVDLRMQRQSAGSYHAHFRSPSRPGRIVRALVQLFDMDGRQITRTTERLRDPNTGRVHAARYSGHYFARKDNIFIVESGRITGDLSETILSPLYRDLPNYLSGITIGVSWRTRRPFATRAIWSLLPERVSAREALGWCGDFSPDSLDLLPPVRSFFESARIADRDMDLMMDEG